MESYIDPQDQGEWFSFRLPMPDGNSIPVRGTREAMDDHFGAEDEPKGFLAAYARNEHLIHAAALHRVVPGTAYTRENPLVLRTQDC